VSVSPTPSVFAQQRNEVLTNASVIKLVRAGFKERTVIAIIHSRPNRFDLDPDRLIEMKHNGVSENIILAMLAQDDSPLSTGDDVSDDAFFRGGQKPAQEKNGDNPQASGTDIFGSSGSSKGQTRGRGMNGSSDGDTLTTGSATVRIMRPPAEAGAGSVKLEKTPTLDNDSVVKLVEAGFSEGTIIKRIENSPVDFDLSPTKLADLRKHRVSDQIIVAMTTAMSDDSGSKTTTPGKPKEN
jgi:hypothetical protein